VWAKKWAKKRDAIQMATGQMEKPMVPEKNLAAVTLGRLGGLKGGRAGWQVDASGTERDSKQIGSSGVEEIRLPLFLPME
jgi:hypothetical protein